MGAEVTGYALEPNTEPDLFSRVLGIVNGRDESTQRSERSFSDGSELYGSASPVVNDAVAGRDESAQRFGKSLCNEEKLDGSASPVVNEAVAERDESAQRSGKGLSNEAEVDGSVSPVENVANAVRGESPQKSERSFSDGSDSESSTSTLRSIIGDVRDFEAMKAAYAECDPDIVIHMAAQPIVRESYRIPRETYEINVMGTVNLMECVRTLGTKRVSVLNVTTDKVYLNEEKKDYRYKEDDKLDGFDPYSNSKSCSELVTHSFKNSFFAGSDCEVRISTARAGNVIGGGDWAKDRIIPDCTRAYLKGESVTVRNPYSVRPYQHVLEPLFVYLTIAMEQYRDAAKQDWYNVGPDRSDCVTTGELCDLFKKYADGFTWIDKSEKNAPHEAGLLMLENAKIKEVFGWKPVWHIDKAVKACADYATALRVSTEAADKELLHQLEVYINEI
ncbi:MAG: CDP-glucose 4,6-dehydratase [Eubacteriales bacterium]|nr:CDP-glucose 4,6-dehydratase [Eubacteriales bacterium]